MSVSGSALGTQYASNCRVQKISEEKDNFPRITPIIKNTLDIRSKTWGSTTQWLADSPEDYSELHQSKVSKQKPRLSKHHHSILFHQKPETSHKRNTNHPNCQTKPQAQHVIFEIWGGNVILVGALKSFDIGQLGWSFPKEVGNQQIKPLLAVSPIVPYTDNIYKTRINIFKLTKQRIKPYLSILDILCLS